ncbi:hypothetical protein DVH24_023132 [Malus domestica]|uniref:Ubiquitin-like domain-containing protein n=1 Tax=Malus domestica TaxID=3750 RepID=A0A498KMJ9_MALDO|nr:hypothetical protein DVH24_023132 [Malus domestica]
MNQENSTIETLKLHIEKYFQIPIFHQRIIISQSLQLLTQSHFASWLDCGCKRSETIDSRRGRAVPNSEDVWLEASRLATSREEKWLAAAVTATLETLQEAYAATPNSKEILLPASKLEFENKKPERVRMLLVKARQEGEGERVWMNHQLCWERIREL